MGCSNEKAVSDNAEDVLLVEHLYQLDDEENLM
jgi:hypothetical protein